MINRKTIIRLFYTFVIVILCVCIINIIKSVNKLVDLYNMNIGWKPTINETYPLNQFAKDYFTLTMYSIINVLVSVGTFVYIAVKTKSVLKKNNQTW